MPNIKAVAIVTANVNSNSRVSMETSSGIGFESARDHSQQNAIGDWANAIRPLPRREQAPGFQ